MNNQPCKHTRMVIGGTNEDSLYCPDCQTTYKGKDIADLQAQLDAARDSRKRLVRLVQRERPRDWITSRGVKWVMDNIVNNGEMIPFENHYALLETSWEQLGKADAEAQSLRVESEKWKNVYLACAKSHDLQGERIDQLITEKNTLREQNARLVRQHSFALMSVLNERLRQNEKWGEQNHPDEVWLAILSEEVGETSQAILHTMFGGKAAGTTRAELVQSCAVALQWIECIDRHDTLASTAPSAPQEQTNG